MLTITTMTMTMVTTAHEAATIMTTIMTTSTIIMITTMTMTMATTAHVAATIMTTSMTITITTIMPMKYLTAGALKPFTSLHVQVLRTLWDCSVQQMILELCFVPKVS